MQVGKLNFTDISGSDGLVSGFVDQAINRDKLTGVYVSEIDPDLSDTAAFCERYQVGPALCANCVIVEARRADKTWHVACVVLANTRADINGFVRRYVDARKVSFAPMNEAVEMTGMEFGAITPIGLPGDWPILIDSAVIRAKNVIIGSGIRKSKLLVSSGLLASLPGAVVMDITKLS